MDPIARTLAMGVAQYMVASEVTRRTCLTFHNCLVAVQTAWPGDDVPVPTPMSSQGWVASLERITENAVRIARRSADVSDVSDT